MASGPASAVDRVRPQGHLRRRAVHADSSPGNAIAGIPPGVGRPEEPLSGPELRVVRATRRECPC